MDTLTEEEKTHLRAEEEFRHQIRKGLEENDRHRGSRFTAWQFLNSNLGLFLLSTILISLLSWSYARWDVTRKLADENRQRINKLDLEIAYRIVRAERTRNIVALARGSRSKETYNATISELNGSKSLFPEFEGQPLFRLLYELYSLIPTNEKGNISKLCNLSRNMFGIEDVEIGPEKRGLKTEDEETMSQFFDVFWPALFDNERWKFR